MVALHSNNAASARHFGCVCTDGGLLDMAITVSLSGYILGKTLLTMTDE